MAWQSKQQAGTKHAASCSAACGRRDMTCPRCQELAGGAPVRSWGQASRQSELRVLAAIKAHDCGQSGCGPFCTFGDY